MPTFDKLLLLDVDETLVHASSQEAPGYFRVGCYEVFERPHLRRFLATYPLQHIRRSAQ